jgi:hypothetical protein
MPAANPPIPWFMPAMISHEVPNGEPAGILWLEVQSGPTPSATESAQIIQQIIPAPHHVHTIKNGILNFSGRSQRNGVDKNQNTTKPTNSGVVVGILDPNVFFMRAYEGQMAVRQTATRRPPFQPKSLSTCSREVKMLPTLHSIPYEVQKHSLRQRDVASYQTPTVSVLHSKADMPFEANPGNQSREKRDQ